MKGIDFDATPVPPPKFLCEVETFTAMEDILTPRPAHEVMIVSTENI